ncbi:MAG: NfeD family protein [Pseudomonadota bacterium]
MMLFLSVLGSLGPYPWFIVGAIFLIAEVILPGVSLIWFGAAASATGALVLFYPLGWEAQMIAFLGFAAVSVLVGRWIAARAVGDDADSVNRGVESMIGRELSLAEAIEHGYGHARYGDSLWRVAGPDLPAGTKVRVVGVEASTLLVTPLGASEASVGPARTLPA